MTKATRKTSARVCGTSTMPDGRKPINLALQGGGAHGAFTWGVLDRLFEDNRLWIEGISGTSAGAMNAVVSAHGIAENGSEGAREKLHDFWYAVAQAGRFSPIQRDIISRLFGNWSLDQSPSYLFFDVVNRFASPYELNPLNINPLKTLLEEQVDFDYVRSCTNLNLFISATNVETGRVKVFERHELTADMVLASACLPFMFQAVEIDGIPYWDGGYMGNPVLFPFFKKTCCDDLLIVKINPLERKGTPKSARDILERVNEITFNSSLLKELRAIEFVSRLIHQDHLQKDTYKDVLVHLIHSEVLMDLGASSKLNSEWEFLCMLKDAGRDAAEQWLDENIDAVGRRSSLDLSALLNLSQFKQQTD